MITSQDLFDREEFTSRLSEHESGKEDALGPIGQLLFKVVTLWAVSYGVDESGFEEPHNNYNDLKNRKQDCNDLLKDLLRSVDAHGILRKPTWDGVRCPPPPHPANRRFVVLPRRLAFRILILPIEVLSPLDRLVGSLSTLNSVETN